MNAHLNGIPCYHNTVFDICTQTSEIRIMCSWGTFWTNRVSRNRLHGSERNFSPYSIFHCCRTRKNLWYYFLTVGFIKKISRKIFTYSTIDNGYIYYPLSGRYARLTKGITSEVYWVHLFPLWCLRRHRGGLPFTIPLNSLFFPSTFVENSSWWSGKLPCWSSGRCRRCTKRPGSSRFRRPHLLFMIDEHWQCLHLRLSERSRHEH